jgi:integrase/recombinase XerD
VSMSKKKKTLRLPLEAWPIVDRTAWERATSPVDYFDDQAHAANWSAATRYQAQCSYGRWLAFVQERWPEVMTLPPAERFNPSRGREYVEQVSTRISAMGVATDLGYLILALRAIAPQADWSWVRRWQHGYQKRAVPREKRAKIIHPSRLVDMGRALMDSADQQERRSERARQFRDGLLISLLAVRPIRRRALSELRIGVHLRQEGDSFALVLDSSNTKSGRAIDMPLPHWLSPYLIRYRDQYRPLFPRAELCDALWMSSKGVPLCPAAIHDLVFRRTKEALGVGIAPHLFRDMAATMIAREAPEALAIARDLLSHADVETTLKHYTQANSLAAARKYNAAILGR